MSHPHDSATPRPTNRLARETSPYLLQHQHNPVDWYPWGDEAFAAAREQNKPIFLSVGYSTCYWCHVMERQSFENEAVALEMNSRFVNIKVDREERPDVDQLYMTAVQVLTRHGGWPMSVFLTPDLRPFYGGTYFPPEDAHGRPGFVTLLRAIHDAYKHRPDDVEKTATQITDILHQLAAPSSPDAPVRIDDKLIADLVTRSTTDYDPSNGGFGHAPKFPRETLLELLLTTPTLSSDSSFILHPSSLSSTLRHTLDAMADGGIRDHLGGGFHRYSTDEKWLVPHFEIMLYDNAMLAWCYAEASKQFNHPHYATVARGILDFTLREMTSPEGAFYTAFDAEVDAQEGLSYLWTADEVKRVLTDEPAKGMGAPFSDADADLFLETYGLTLGPNFADPHHGTGRPDKNILYLPRPLAQVAQSKGIPEPQLESLLARMRGYLYAERRQRKQPLLDTKIITSWNALMIRAMAHAGRVLNEPRYTTAAARAADLLLKHHRKPDGTLYRTSRDGQPRHDAFLDDYAFLAQALLALADSGIAHGDYRKHAESIASTMLDRFGDRSHGGFFFTAQGANDIIIRQKTATDSPLPSGNAVAATVLLQLGHPDPARATVAAFAAQLDGNAESMSSLLQAAAAVVRATGPIEVSPAGPAAGAPDRPLSPQELAQNVVSLEAEMPSPDLLLITLTILPGFHINTPAPAKGLIPTTLSLRDIEFDSVDYPPGQSLSFPFSDDPVQVYSGRVTIPVRLPHAPTAPFQLTLNYQPCDDTACLPPVTKTVRLAPQ